MTRNLQKIIDEQVAGWSVQSAQWRVSGSEKPYPIITISREFGAGGALLSAELGRRTGFEIWDKDLVQAVADESGGDQRVMATLDERRRRSVEDAVQGALLGSRHTNTQYHRSLLRVIQVIEAHGNSIVVGRGANYICRSSDILKVRVICPLQIRARRWAEQHGMVLKEAMKEVKQRDDERRQFVQHLFKRDVSDPADYDLTVNAASYPIEQIAEIVLHAYVQKTGRTLEYTPLSS